MRRPRVQDWKRLQEIAKGYDFVLPDNPLRAQVVERDGKVVALGLIRILAEAILICEGSDRDKVHSLFELICQCIKDAKELNLPQIHIFVKDNKFADILIKKFNFVEEQGRTLVLEIK